MEASTTNSGHENSNLISKESCIAKDGTQYNIQYQMSDEVLQQFEGLGQKLFHVPVQQMQLLFKELDKPLHAFSKIAASILGIKTRHQFLLLKTSNFLITIDFYEDNRICVRMGDLMTVLQTPRSDKRKQAKIVKTEEGLEWRRSFKEDQLLVGDILDCLKHKQLQKAFSKISFNGSHFSRKIWTDLCQLTEKKY